MGISQQRWPPRGPAGGGEAGAWASLLGPGGGCSCFACSVHMFTSHLRGMESSVLRVLRNIKDSSPNSVYFRFMSAHPPPPAPSPFGGVGLARYLTKDWGRGRVGGPGTKEGSESWTTVARCTSSHHRHRARRPPRPAALPSTLSASYMGTREQGGRVRGGDDTRPHAGGGQSGRAGGWAGALGGIASSESQARPFARDGAPPSPGLGRRRGDH